MIKRAHDLSVVIKLFFSDFRPTSMEKGQELVRMRIYNVYAWGMPIIITTVAAILDNLPESPTETFLRPRFGKNKCWFYGEFRFLRKFFQESHELKFVSFPAPFS